MFAGALLFSTIVAGCGGRVARPVSATNGYDGLLSCDHLRAERTFNDAKLADLMQERKLDNQNNAAMLLGGPLAMIDLSGSEQKEGDALVKRNVILDQLIAQKCLAQ